MLFWACFCKISHLTLFLSTHLSRSSDSLFVCSNKSNPATRSSFCPLQIFKTYSPLLILFFPYLYSPKLCTRSSFCLLRSAEPIHRILSWTASISRTHPHDPLSVCFNQPDASIWSFFVCVNQPNPSTWSSLCLFQSAEPIHMILLCLCQSAEPIHMILSWSAPISRTHPHDPLCVCFNQPNRREIIL